MIKKQSKYYFFILFLGAVALAEFNTVIQIIVSIFPLNLPESSMDVIYLIFIFVFPFFFLLSLNLLMLNYILSLKNTRVVISHCLTLVAIFVLMQILLRYKSTGEALMPDFDFKDGFTGSFNRLKGWYIYLISYVWFLGSFGVLYFLKIKKSKELHA